MKYMITFLLLTIGLAKAMHQEMQQAAADTGALLAGATQPRIDQQLQLSLPVLSQTNLAELPVELQEKIALDVVKNSQTLEAGLRNLKRFLMSNKGLSKHLKNKFFIKQLKDDIISDNKQAELDALLITYSRAGDEIAVAFLLKLGANANAADEYGETALMGAVQSGNIDVVKLLIALGANVKGNTVLMAAVSSGLAGAIKEWKALGNKFSDPEFGKFYNMLKLEIIKELIKAGADVNAADRNGKTVLMEAAAYSNKELVELLLSMPTINAHARDYSGRSALDHARIPGVTTGNKEIKQLIQDALIVGAAQKGATQMVEDLINAGANADAISGEGASALMQAAYNGHVSTVKVLLDAGADVNKVIHLPNKQATNALQVAVQNGHTQTVQVLIDAGADVNSIVGNRSAMMIAAQIGNVQIVKMLIKAKAIVDMVDSRKQTALMFAAALGHVDVIQALLDAGANIQAVNNQGATALMFAILYGHKEVIEVLLSAGADINAFDNFGNTVLAYARKSGNQEVIQLIQDALSKQK